ncbi:MAG TPA: dienelactone hydrolase family protein [Chakrabartia sp.]|jgi:carboxymethylenebutenolidase|nr:dienelactone hydrolase family protein [Chakrabartia sp.]
MCDEQTETDLEKAGLNRREFAAGIGAAGVAALAPVDAWAADLAEMDVQVKTPDGVADAHFVRPAKGKHPAVLVWPDIWGLRPAFQDMARRMAAQGYAVLTVNPFYRDVKAPIVLKGDNPRSPENFAIVRGYAAKLKADAVMRDATAYLAFLDRQKGVDKRKGAGVTGYCMGGPLVLGTAAAVPNRIRAGATFHSVALVTDAPDSPHLLLPKTRAAFRIATARNDDEQRPAEKGQLAEAFKAAGLKGEVDVYPAMHGWVPPGGPAHDAIQAERAWAAMFDLFKANLK